MTEKKKRNGGLSRRNFLSLLRQGAIAMAFGLVAHGCGGGGSSGGGGAPPPTTNPPPTQTVTVGATTRKEGAVQTDNLWAAQWGTLYTQVNVNSTSLGDTANGKDLNYEPFQPIEANQASVNVGSNVTWREVSQGTPATPNKSESFQAT